MKQRKRDPDKTRSHIMEVAFGEILELGFQGVSVNNIMAKTKVTKGAFFHHFPTKNDLGYAIIDEYLKHLVIERWIQPLAAYDNPLVGIEKNLRRIIDETETHLLQHGCPLNNLSQEMSTVDSVFHDKLRGVWEFWIDELENYIKLAKQRGFLKTGISTRQVAEFVVMVHEGSLGMTKITRDKKTWLSLHQSLRIYLSAICQD